MKKLIEEKGSITVVVFATITFILIILATIYTTTIYKHKSQAIELQDLKDIYSMEGEEKINKLYNQLSHTRNILEGQGTQEDPYKIYTIEDLVRFSNRTNYGESFQGKYVELMATLDFNDNSSYENPTRIDYGDINQNGEIEPLKLELTTGKGFPCISLVAENAFEGIFNGNENKIMNLYIKNSTSNMHLGLFGHVGNSLIQNLEVTGNLSTDVDSNIGGIVGLKKENTDCTIKNCYNSCSITNSAQSNIGGIIGSTGEGMLYIIDCHNAGDLNGGNRTGGILGYVNGNVDIKNCYNAGNITNTRANSFIGGLVGEDNKKTITIANSNNTGILNGIGYVGGLVAKTSETAKISDSYNSGDITGTKGVGGIVGNTAGALNITNSYNQGSITGYNDVGGLAGTITGSTVNIINSYNTDKISGMHYVGGITGQQGSANGTIENCHNSGEIEGLDYTGGLNNSIGGITGTNYGKILKSYNEGSINGCKNCIGGISGSNNGTINMCLNNGNVNSTGQSGTGGIVGFAASSNSKVLNCYNKKTINGKNAVGGIVGNNDSGEIKRCYSISEVTGITGGLIHCIVGNKGKSAVVTDCYYLSALSITDSNATPKTEVEMKLQDFVDLLNTDNENQVWTQDTANLNLGYPILKWQTEQ